MTTDAGVPTLEMRAEIALGALHLRIDLRSRADRIAIVGPSGAGKSTCLRVLAGLERPTGGVVRFRGEPWLADGQHVPAWERAVGWVPQDALLFPHHDVRRNLRWAGRARDGEVARVARWLEIDDLLERRPRNLSGGERKRVALGRALLARPRLLLLDEPFAALDAPMRDRVAAALRAHCDEHGIPLVLVSHDSVDLHVLGVERWELAQGRVTRSERADSEPLSPASDTPGT